MDTTLAPHDGPLDRAHLARMTLGDLALEREVLGMFVVQSRAIVDTLKAGAADARALAHTLKGSARAIGAFAVAASAAALEETLARGEEADKALAALGAAVTEACAAISAIPENSR